jgi:RNA polymerase sigma-70 factor (ECF subfamily)
MDQKKDVEIVAGIIKGDRQSYALLVEKYQGPIFNLALRMTGSHEEASDLTQDIFIRAYQKLALFDPRKKYFTWLYTIGINLIRNYLKKKARETAVNQLPEEKQPVLQIEGLGDDHDEDNLAYLKKAMLALNVEAREAILLKYHQGLTFDEVAEITGLSISAVKMRVYRGLEQLKQMLKERA